MDIINKINSILNEVSKSKVTDISKILLEESIDGVFPSVDENQKKLIIKNTKLKQIKELASGITYVFTTYYNSENLTFNVIVERD